MNRRTIAALVSAGLAIVSTAACEFDPTTLGALPAFSECAGRPATIGVGWDPETDPAWGSTYEGTDGDDVVVIVNGPVRFNAGAGDDLICINATGVAWGDDNAGVRIGAGAGNDVVLSAAPSDGDRSWDQFPDVVVRLGDGDDLFIGQGADEAVYGGDGADVLVMGAGGDIVYVDELDPHVDCGDDEDLYMTSSSAPSIRNCEWQLVGAAR